MNRIDLVLFGSDQTGPAFKSASKYAQGLGRDFTNTGRAANALGNIASSLGAGPIASVIDSFNGLLSSSGQLTQQLTKSKAAMAALATVAVAGGFQIGKALDEAFFSGKEVRALESAEKFGEVWSGVLNRISALRGGEHADNLRKLNDIDREIAAVRKLQEVPGVFGINALGGKSGLKPEEVNALVEKMNQLRDETKIKQTEETNRKISDLEREMETEQLSMLVENLGAKSREMQRYNEELRTLEDNKLLNDDQRYTLEQSAYRTHQLKLAQIHMENQDRIVANEKARRTQSLSNFSNYAQATGSILGSLATIAEASGKKSFALTQALRYAEAVVNTAAAVANALASPAPWPIPLAFAAAAAAAGAAQIAVISSVKPPQAHGGLDYVPAEETYLLSQGERVIQPSANEDLTSFLQQGNRPIVVNVDGRELFRLMEDASGDGRMVLS